jgi:hypothetical protein
MHGERARDSASAEGGLTQRRGDAKRRWLADQTVMLEPRQQSALDLTRQLVLPDAQHLSAIVFRPRALLRRGWRASRVRVPRQWR